MNERRQTPAPRQTAVLTHPVKCPLSAPTGQRGSGPGLTIAREIVTRHGGDIQAESQPGQGAKFTITLPRSSS